MITNRKQIRLKKYDYTQSGYYFVTLCTQNRENMFGEIVDGKIVLNGAGNIIHTQWNGLLNRFHNIELDEFVVMPNHFHGIIHIVGAFKSITTNEYINGVKQNHWPPFNKRLWQRNYYEHIIRNENELRAIREYIEDNPQ